MNKNILITGPDRSGKTTLALKLSKELNYNIISIDDIVTALEIYPNLKIHHYGDELQTSKNLNLFLKIYLKELSQGKIFNSGQKTIIEGTYIDLDYIAPLLQQFPLVDKYEIIGLTYNYLTKEDLYNMIKKYDTKDDWTYLCSSEELKTKVDYFYQRNKYFNQKFQEYNIKKYDTSNNRNEVLESIIKEKKLLKKNNRLL